MRRTLSLLVLGVLAAAFVPEAALAGAGTTAGTTTTTTTTSSTTTATPSYAPLSLSPLPAGCVGAGAAALVPPSHPVIALGTPGTSLGASAYSTASGAVLSFDSSTLSASTCKSAGITLGSVSLFGGVVTASSVHATDGIGTVAGLEIDGAAVSASAGQTVSVDGWGQLTLGATVGRVTAPLVLRLLQTHDSLAAGTAVVVAFAASAHPIAKQKPRGQRQAGTDQTHTTSSSRSQGHSARTHQAKKHRRWPQRPPPDYPASPSPFGSGGHFTDAVQDNPIVSTALQYLGVNYQWGGATPKTGFDCSGLVQYVFAQLGVPLVHFAAAQYRSPGSVWIPPDRLEPGDLVFFTGSDGTRKEPGHVGIYVDDGYIIDAPHTGAFVRIDSLNEPQLANQYVGAKKIVAPLDSRHPLPVTKGAASIPTAPLMIPLQMTSGASGVTPLIAAIPVAAHTGAPRGYAVWTGVGIGGALSLVLAGTIAYRRRRSPTESRAQAEG